MTREQAIKSARTGAFVAFGVCGLTAVISLYATRANVTEGSWSLFNDPTIIADILLSLICGFGLLRQSRAAAVIVFTWFVLSKIYQFVEYPSATAGGGLLIALVILFFFAKAIRATFRFHKLEKEQNPHYRTTSKWAYILGIPTGLIALVLIVFGFLTTTDILPSTNVISGQELSASDTTVLIDNLVVLPEERIEYFYSEGFLSIKEGGSVLTDKRVISYWQEDGTIQSSSITFEEVARIELIEQGNYLNDSVYKVFDNNGYWLVLWLSSESRGDITFIDALRQKIGN